MERVEEDYVEPQAAEAVRILKNKGYKIGSLAGSSGNPTESKQAIVFESPRRESGKRSFDEATMEILRNRGFQQYSGAMPVDTIGLEFQVEADDPTRVAHKWRELAELLPEVKG